MGLFYERFSALGGLEEQNEEYTNFVYLQVHTAIGFDQQPSRVRDAVIV
jgi:hypothetical protein